VTAGYTANNPFPGKQPRFTGCLFCDSVLSATIINPFIKQKTQPVKKV
jgi:hypothetical protein